MKKYIGTKQIEAEPMTMGEAYEKNLLQAGRVPNESEKDKAGYHVKYEGGYESWSPAEPFEKAYKVADTPLDKQFMEEMWVARDENGDLYFHGISKPEKDTGEGMWISNNYNPYYINQDSFPEVKWSDDEPTKVKLVIEK